MNTITSEINLSDPAPHKEPERQYYYIEKAKEYVRKEYIDSVRRNLRGQLDNISVKEADGSITNLGEKYGNKKGH